MQFKWISYILLGALGFTFCSNRNQQGKESQGGDEVVNTSPSSEFGVVNNILKFGHFSPPTINDDFSNRVFNLYIKRLDYGKRFLLKSDIDLFSASKNDLDDQFNNSSLAFFNQVSGTYAARIKEAQTYYKEILAKPFEFETDETLQIDPKKYDFATSKDDLKNNWRKYLKHQVLIRVNENLNLQEKALAKKDTSVKQKSFDVLEQEARKRVLKVHDDWFARMLKTSQKDREAMYINAYCSVFDTHTEFFPPKEKKDFDIHMSGQLEGIGATLQERDGNIKVAGIVSGGPAFKQGELKENDVIIKVAQDKGEAVDIQAMPLDDAIQLIRGKKGTIVNLTVRKPDATIKIISIKRDIVVIEETFAQSAIIETKNGKVGFIRLPSFYNDFSRKTSRSCATDILEEVKKLKEDKVTGIIIDLRSNGGGSLDDVVKMSGFFIDQGPIVQVKGNKDNPNVLKDFRAGYDYDGPLAIMVNNSSASASEIMAAALQDYKRAIIIGDKSTYGKGTVQRFYGLNEFAGSNEDMGALKMTMQKFYRVNGSSTQLRGVVPDVILPDPYSEVEEGEKDSDIPLPYDEIAKSDYSQFTSNWDYNNVISNSRKRVEKSPTFKLIQEQSDWVKKEKDNSIVYLNLKKFQEDEKKDKDYTKKFENLYKENKDLNVTFTGTDRPSFSADTTKKARFNQWFKSIKKDIYIGETINIIQDMKGK